MQGRGGAHSTSALNPEERLARQATEQLRWYDYWLKGIDNGIMEEPAVHYATRLDEDDWTWRSADAWPPVHVAPVTYYFDVHLEEVDAGGVSHYVTEGVLRASHRTLAEPPFDNMGLPYHRSYEADIQPLPKGEPAALVFDLLPTSNLFNAGYLIRVTIACADADNAERRYASHHRPR